MVHALLMQVKGDAGCWLRCAMGALVLCGIPDEKYWPYTVADFDKEPDAFVYSITDNYEAAKYFCHDPQGAKVPYPTILDSVKKYLAAGIPSMFGFWGFPSYDKSDVKGGRRTTSCIARASRRPDLKTAGLQDSERSEQNSPQGVKLQDIQTSPVISQSAIFLFLFY